MNNLPSPASSLPEQHVFRPISVSVSPEQKLELLEYWRSITKRKWAILALGVVAGLLAAAISFAVTPEYRSTATVLIEAGKGKILSIEDVYSGAIGQNREHYQTQVEILKSRDIAVRTARAVRLWERPEYDPRIDEDSWWARSKAALGIGQQSAPWSEERLADASATLLMKDLQIDPVRLSQLVKVSFDSSDRVLATRVANELARNYIEADREGRFNLSQQVSQWLQERLSSLRDKLTQSETALQNYREKAGLVSLGGSATTLAGQQVGGTSEKLIEARSRRTELDSAYKQINKSRGDYASVPGVARDPGVAEAQARVNEASRTVAELSQQLGSEHVTLKEAQANLAEAQASLRQTRETIANSIKREYLLSLETERQLTGALESARSNVQSVNRQEFELAVLEREVDSNRQLYDMFMSRAKETNMASDVQAAVARVVDPAVEPKLPVKPQRAQITAIALVLGLFIGALVSLLLDKLDNTVKGGDDAEVRLKQPLLTVLPIIPELQNVDGARVFLENPQSHHAEAIRTARTGVLLSNIDMLHKVLLVTSTVPGEGKTTVASNLALAHAQTRRTLLIDADMRRPQIARRLGLPQGCKGISNLISGTAAPKDCVHSIPGSNLFVMPVGDMPPNPLELLLSQRFRDALTALSQQFEVVLIDSPPVELVSDAIVIAPLATSVIYVVKAMSTPAPLVRKCIGRLQRAGGSMLGVVVNQLDFSKAQKYHGEYGAAGYYSYGGYGYAPTIEDQAAAKAAQPVVTG